MADLEQRRQQYNEMHRQQASAADPGSLKLALQLLNLLPLSDENKAAGADWLARKHKSGTSEDIGTAESLLTAGASMFPPVGITLEEQAREDALKRGEDPSMLPLMLAMMPMGAGKATGATRAARLLEGAGKALGPAAVIGGPLLMASSAHAGETDQIQSQMQTQLEALNSEIAAVTKRRNEEAQTGYGPKAQAADARLGELRAEQERLTGELRQRDAGESNRLGMGAAGLGAGAALSLLPTLLSRGHARGKVSSFEGAADELARLTEQAGASRVTGTPTGDRMTALVNEAYKDAGTSMPFLRGGAGPTARPPEAPRRYSALSKSYHDAPAADEALFANSGKAPGDLAIPFGLGVEGLASSAIGSGALEPFGVDISPENAKAFQDVGAASLGAATGYKMGRFMGKSALPKPTAQSRASVTAARSRLERETQGPARPTLWQKMTGRGPEPLPGGPVSPEPVDATRQVPTGEATTLPPPTGQPSPSGSPQATPALLPSSEPPSDLPGSLAPVEGAKKAKQPRPRRDAQGRLRNVLGEFEKGKVRTPKGQK